MSKTQSVFKASLSLVLLAVLTVARAHSAEHLGTVSFPVSCSPAVQADFNRGVALLHDFWYEESKPQFQRILAKDPGCAMAHWGIVMSQFHQIWDRPDAATMASARQELQAARSRPPRTARERAYLAALSGFFRPVNADYQARIDAYAAAMGRIYASHPGDVDAGAFYALALMAAEAPTDTSLSQERKAMAVLTPLWTQYPDHPGLVHYIVHACDTPSLAASGLSAARHYGRIASSGPHAAHMPGHIFSRLGLWQEDIDSQLASISASEAAAVNGQSGWMDQFHSDDFIAYAYLQRGQEERARKIVANSQQAIDHYETMPDMAEHVMMQGMFPYYRVKLPIFVALETRDWHAAQTLEPISGAPPDTQVLISWARIIGDGHLHDAARAHTDLAMYDALMDAVRTGEHAYYADSTGAQIRRGEMLAWQAFADGDIEAAIKQMRASADLQDTVGQGEVDIPAREMLGDILLEANQPADAFAEYQQALQLSPNRFNGLFGAGKAAEAAGQPGEARNYYAKLLASTDDGAQSLRAEIQHARAYTSTARVMQ